MKRIKLGRKVLPAALGSAGFSIPGGRSVPVQIVLPKGAFAALMRVRTLKVQVQIHAIDAAGNVANSRATVKFTAPQPRSRR